MDSCAKQKLVDQTGWKDIAGEFSLKNGITMLEITDNGGIGQMELTPDKCNGNGEVHGGAFCALADTVAGSAVGVWVKRHLEEGTSSVTLSSSINFLRAARNCTRILCKATFRKMGRTMGVVDISIYGDNKVELCSGSSTFYFIDLKRYQKNK